MIHLMGEMKTISMLLMGYRTRVGFTNLHPRREVQYFVLLVSRFQSGSAILCPFLLLAVTMLALQRIPSLDHRLTYEQATRMAFQSCS